MKICQKKSLVHVVQKFNIQLIIINIKMNKNYHFNNNSIQLNFKYTIIKNAINNLSNKCMVFIEFIFSKKKK